MPLQARFILELWYPDHVTIMNYHSVEIKLPYFGPPATYDTPSLPPASCSEYKNCVG